MSHIRVSHTERYRDDKAKAHLSVSRTTKPVCVFTSTSFEPSALNSIMSAAGAPMSPSTSIAPLSLLEDGRPQSASTPALPRKKNLVRSNSATDSFTALDTHGSTKRATRGGADTHTHGGQWSQRHTSRGAL